MASEDPMAFQFESSLQGEEKIDDEEEYGMARYMSGLSIETNFFQGDDDGQLSDDTQLIPPASDEYSEQNELCLCGNYPLPPVVIKEYYYASTDDEGKKGSVLMREEEEEETNTDTDTWRRSNYCSSSSTSPGRRMRKENYKKKKEEQVITSTTTTTSIGFDHQHHHHHLELEIVPSLYNSPFDLETSSSGTTSPNWRISSPGDDPRDVKARLKMWAQAVAASASKYATTSLHFTTSTN